ncbi:alkaline phosphatase, partial [Bacillus pumilus]
MQDSTYSAIKQLPKNKKGVYLMIEGSESNWEGQNHEYRNAMSEMKEFEKTLEEASSFAKKDKNTLVITTDDHSTGGISYRAD